MPRARHPHPEGGYPQGRMRDTMRKPSVLPLGAGSISARSHTNRAGVLLSSPPRARASHTHNPAHTYTLCLSSTPISPALSHPLPLPRSKVSCTTRSSLKRSASPTPGGCSAAPMTISTQAPGERQHQNHLQGPPHRHQDPLNHPHHDLDASTRRETTPKPPSGATTPTPRPTQPPPS